MIDAFAPTYERIALASGPFPWKFLLVETALLIAAAFYIFSAALALSFLRRWLLLAVGIILWGMLWLRAEQLPYLSLFDPVELVRPGLDGLSPRVSWRLEHPLRSRSLPEWRLPIRLAR